MFGTNYIKVNERMGIKLNIQNIIQNSDLPERQKIEEIEFLNNAVTDDDVFDLQFIRDNFNKTAFIRVYAYYLGYTDVKTKNDLQVNIKFFNSVGDVASSINPLIGGLGTAISTVTGTSTTCGIFGSVFNTKKCRDKQANIQNSQNVSLPPQITTPQYVPAVVPPVQPQQSFVQQERNQERKKEEFPYILLVGGAVLLFLFLKK